MTVVALVDAGDLLIFVTFVFLRVLTTGFLTAGLAVADFDVEFLRITGLTEVDLLGVDVEDVETAVSGFIRIGALVVASFISP